MLHGCAGFDVDKPADSVSALVLVLVDRVFVDTSRRSTRRSWLSPVVALALVLGLALGLLVIPSATPSAAADNCNCNCACDRECNVNSAAMRSIRTPFVPDDWMPVARAMRCNCADFKHASQGWVGEYSTAVRRIGGFVCVCLPRVALGAGSGLPGTGTITSTVNTGFPCLAVRKTCNGNFRLDAWALEGDLGILEGGLLIGARAIDVRGYRGTGSD